MRAGVFDSHCFPFDGTTIMPPLASGADIIDCVTAALPHALLTAAEAAVVDLAIGFLIL
jgi:Na+/H+ antiporter NhaC